MFHVISELAPENREPNTLQGTEALEEDTDLTPEDLLASLSENSTENQFPDVPPDDMEDEEILMDESLSPLEKIFLYVKSELVFHRVFIARELPTLIRDVEISEAVEYVLPLMNSLGTDPEDHVKETFATELDDIIWFYYSVTTDCSQTDIAINSRPLTPQRPQTPQQRPQTPIQQYHSQQTLSQPPTPTNNIPYLSPSAFTPLLHALLLDQNTAIAQAAQNVILSLVDRILEEPSVNPKEKELLEKETLEGVVLGIGRLDQDKARKEETNEWEPYGDEHGAGAMSGGEEEAELGRMTMMSLISSLAPIVGPERCIRLFLPELEKMIDEQVFYVRKEAATALGRLSGVLPLETIESKLLPDEMKSERAVNGIKIFAEDVSRSVRSAAGEIIGELIATFDPNGKVPENLVQHFLNLGPLRESNVKVRRTLSYSLHEIAKVIGPKKTEEDLLPVFTYYLVDMDEVKSGVMENYVSFISCLPQTARDECLPSLSGIWDNLKPQWRLRNTIAKQIPALCQLFDGSSIINYLLPLAIKAVKDEVATVRETTVACFPALFEAVHNDDTLFKEAIKRVCEFSSENKFRSRVIFVQICYALVLSGFPKLDFERYFLPILENFSADSVVNVRITLVRVIKELCQTEQYYQDPISRPPQILGMINRLAEDPDFEVHVTIEGLSESVTNEAMNEENNLDSQGIVNFTSMIPEEDLNVVDIENNGSASVSTIIEEVPISYIKNNNVIDMDNNNITSTGSTSPT
ncbi:11618_t:CDS:10 [Entrophospora sp. SA101]|nr:11618_t:CDS:10 [Entrophospora sp. SA101]